MVGEVLDPSDSAIQTGTELKPSKIPIEQKIRIARGELIPMEISEDQLEFYKGAALITHYLITGIVLSGDYFVRYTFIERGEHKARRYQWLDYKLEEGKVGILIEEDTGRIFEQTTLYNFNRWAKALRVRAEKKAKQNAEKTALVQAAGENQ